MEPKYGVVYKVQPEPMDPAACTPFEEIGRAHV